MSETALTPLLVLAGTGLALLLYRTIRAAHARRLSRLAYFDRCKPLLTATRFGKGATGFPRLSGLCKGSECDLQVVPDTLTFRKLPALWVLISLPCPLPVRATLDLMIRPTGVESLSGFHRLPEQIALPGGCPEDCAIRTDQPRHLLPEHVLRPHLSLFDDPRIKELVISPKGLRIVFLAEEANRSRYLLFRDAEMGRTAISPDRILPVLDRLLAIKADIERHSRHATREAA
ncbi:hypothetical protein [Paracoccus methylarcula]|uniref:DUF3137 domain-containing protein n=1 Tax=Paracoccus methylarcula TaxID=72022 RepID=A0A422QXR4_9RHOB|nr:hypothetical protein [Paracoccus methylarcula]RNF34739.1 hypothetical protein A7A09_010045 [Paracoccus methylarcula]